MKLPTQAAPVRRSIDSKQYAAGSGVQSQGIACTLCKAACGSLSGIAKTLCLAACDNTVC